MADNRKPPKPPTPLAELDAVGSPEYVNSVEHAAHQYAEYLLKDRGGDLALALYWMQRTLDTSQRAMEMLESQRDTGTFGIRKQP